MNVDAEIETMWSDFFGGLVRKIAQLKQTGEMSMIEGKQPMSFAGYQFLALKALHQQRDMTLSIFGHLFLVLCWNLMARSASVASLMFDHFGWEQDSLVITFPAHKGVQEGQAAMPKHVYANPSQPAICPILSLAVFVFTLGFRREGAKRVVFGDTANSESRFSKWLSRY